jgi:hypothetical protein
MTHPDWKISKYASGNYKYEFGYSRNLGPSAMQAAILIVTDDAGHDGLAGIRIFYRNLNPSDMAHAMQLCAETGIDIKNKRIWRDREKILAGLSEGELKSWLSDFIKP